MVLKSFFLYFIKNIFLAGFCLSLLTGFTIISLVDIIKWDIENGESVKFILNPSGCDCNLTDEEVKEIFIKSMNSWNSVKDSYFKFENLEDTDPELFEIDFTLSSKKPKYDDDWNVIGFDNSVPDYAAAYAQWKIDDKYIKEADIHIKPGLDYWNKKTLQSTVTHELGHALGLGHDHTDVESIMSYGRDRDRLRLGSDDIIGTTVLYPKSGKEPKPDWGCTTIIPDSKYPPFLGQQFFNFLLFFIFLSIALYLVKILSKKRTGFYFQSFSSSTFSFYKGIFLGTCVILIIAACADYWEDGEKSSLSTIDSAMDNKKNSLLGTEINGSKITFFCPAGR